MAALESRRANAPMTADEARTCVEDIRRGALQLRTRLLDLQEREGWRALGYPSWRACVVAEFGQSQRSLYNALTAAEVERALQDSAKPPRQRLPDSQALELARLRDPETIGEVWQEVTDTTPDGEITARRIREVVERRIQAPAVERQVEAEPMPAALDICTVPRWKAMTADQRSAVMDSPRSVAAKFNAQSSTSIEWALWSWNPVTGCLHDCAYCYARDLANRHYSYGFVPAFLPERLDAPKNTRVPPEAATSIGHRNVFTCSMADLFGRWVPREWIDAVLGSCAANPQWNFLFLTKFPNRLAEFEFPDNAWVGTSVDAQARVANAERSMARVRAKVRWLSCEPLLEPLRFSDLSVVDWVVIGGASRSTETPEFRPPRSWIEDLERQARAAGCRVYEKANLLERIRDYPGGEDVAGVDVPTAFKMRYLQRDVIDPESYRQETDVEG